MVCDVSMPTSPPDTRPPHTGQKLRTDSPPRNDGGRTCRFAALKLTASLEKPVNGMKPPPAS